MRTRRLLHTTARLLLIFLACVGAVGARAQAPARRTSRVASAGCELEGVKFRCPGGFKAAKRGEGERLLFFEKKGSGLGLFVAVPPEGASAEDFAADSAEKAVAKLLPGEKSPFRWRPLENRGEQISKYDVFWGGVQGFNGNVLVAAAFRFVRFGGKSFVVGYVTEGARGEAAAAAFGGGGEVADFVGCETVARVVYSATGEKFDEDSPPCTLAVIAPITDNK